MNAWSNLLLTSITILANFKVSMSTPYDLNFAEVPQTPNHQNIKQGENGQWLGYESNDYFQGELDSDDTIVFHTLGFFKTPSVASSNDSPWILSTAANGTVDDLVIMMLCQNIGVISRIPKSYPYQEIIRKLQKIKWITAEFPAKFICLVPWSADTEKALFPNQNRAVDDFIDEHKSKKDMMLVEKAIYYMYSSRTIDFSHFILGWKYKNGNTGQLADDVWIRKVYRIGSSLGYLDYNGNDIPSDFPVLEMEVSENTHILRPNQACLAPADCRIMLDHNTPPDYILKFKTSIVNKVMWARFTRKFIESDMFNRTIRKIVDAILSKGDEGNWTYQNQITCSFPGCEYQHGVIFNHDLASILSLLAERVAAVLEARTASPSNLRFVPLMYHPDQRRNVYIDALNYDSSNVPKPSSSFHHFPADRKIYTENPTVKHIPQNGYDFIEDLELEVQDFSR